MDSTAADLGAEDEWELCNDDGFVYKRKRRRLDAAPPVPAVIDPEEEKRRRRERKRTILLKLKNQYQREIDHWEYLSNTLRALEEESIQVQREREPEIEQVETTSYVSSPSGLVKERDGGNGSLVDDLLLQLEAQEAIIHDITNLCDVAEAMCNSQEERLKQSLIDLPIWGSPRELMASLCDE